MILNWEQNQERTWRTVNLTWSTKLSNWLKKFMLTVCRARADSGYNQIKKNSHFYCATMAMPWVGWFSWVGWWVKKLWSNVRTWRWSWIVANHAHTHINIRSATQITIGTNGWVLDKFYELLCWRVVVQILFAATVVWRKWTNGVRKSS